MSNSVFPVIDLAATGDNIRRLRIERGLTVKDLQSYFGFEEPRAIYKWQKGETLPSVDNLYALGNLLDVPMDQILIPVSVKLHIFNEQQAEACCSSFLSPAIPDTASTRCNFNHLLRTMHLQRDNARIRSILRKERSRLLISF